MFIYTFCLHMGGVEKVNEYAVAGFTLGIMLTCRVQLCVLHDCNNSIHSLHNTVLDSFCISCVYQSMCVSVWCIECVSECDCVCV